MKHKTQGPPLPIAEGDDRFVTTKQDAILEHSQVVVLNEDCPKSPIAAVRLDAYRGKNSPYGTSVSVLFKDGIFPEDLMARILSGAPVKCDGTDLVTTISEPHAEFLKTKLGVPKSEIKYYTVEPKEEYSVMSEVLEVLHHKGLIGENVFRTGKEFAAALTRADYEREMPLPSPDSIVR